MMRLTTIRILSLYLISLLPLVCLSFQHRSIQTRRKDISLYLGPFGSSLSEGASKAPSSQAERDKQAIGAIKAAIERPKTKSFPMIECEFPPLASLNKQGDGSLTSSKQVDDVNLAFCSKLVQSLAPIPLLGPKVRLLLSSSCTQSFLTRAAQKIKGATSVASLRGGIPPDSITPGDICILLSPSNQNDYQLASKIVSEGVAKALVIVNGLAKDQKSIPGIATMAYFEKPLTYNSQVVGCLVRSYPSKWTTIDLISKEVLGSFTDENILVGGTNTPDLRESGRLVQKSVDQRAIRSRKN